MLTELNTTPPAHLIGTPLMLPLANARVIAGFPSPAEDTGYRQIDLTRELITHPQATFIVEVEGDSVRDFGIFHKDRLVVDKALEARHGDIVVAVVDNLFTVKKLYKRGGRVKLQAGNITYPDIVFKDGQTLVIWGVATFGITQLRR